MKLVTWNVDGLCDTATTQRTLAALDLLLPHSPTPSLTPPPKPDVIFLQEVVPHTEHLFTRKLLANGYHSAAPPPNGAPYYTMCYYNPHTIKPMCVRGQQQGQYQQGQYQQEQGHRYQQGQYQQGQDQQYQQGQDRYQQGQDRYQQQQGAGGAGGGSRVQYTGDARSQMGRDILLLRCLYEPPPHSSDKPTKLLVLNSHLESEKRSASVRTAQLTQLAKLVWDEAQSSGAVALIAGDLNMRDNEAKQAVQTVRDITGDESFDLNDAYFHFGKPKELSKTWIMPDKPAVGCRFDRVYHSCHCRNIEFESLKHIGTKKVASIGMTPSDHYGLVLDIKLTGTTDNAGSPAGCLLRGVAKAPALSKKRNAKTAEMPEHKPSKSMSSGEVAGVIPKSHIMDAVRSMVLKEMKSADNIFTIGGGNNSTKLDNEDTDDEDLKRALDMSVELAKSVSRERNNNLNKSSAQSSSASGSVSSSAPASVSEKEKRRAGFLMGLARRSKNMSESSCSTDAQDLKIESSRNNVREIEVIELSD